MFERIIGRVYNNHIGREYFEVMVHEDDDCEDYELCASYSTGVLTGKYTGGCAELALECHAWGYDGLGPQLLASNILTWYAEGGSEDIARKYYKEFTAEVIANLPVDESWELTKEQIKSVVEKQNQNQREK